VLIAPGLSVWGVRMVSKDRAHAGRFLILVNATQLLLATLVFALVAAASPFWPDRAEATMVLFAAVGMFGVAASVQWVCQALDRISLIGPAQMGASVATLIGVLLLVHQPRDAARVPLLMLAGQLITSVVLLATLARQGVLRLERLSPSWGLDAFRGGLALGVSQVLIAVLHHANSLLLQVFRGSRELGLFSAGFRLVDLLAFVPASITTVFLSRLARSYATDRVAAAAGVRVYLGLVVTVGFAIGGMMVVEAPSIVALLYGPQFAPAVPVVRIMGASVAFNFLATAYVFSLIAAGEDRTFLRALVLALLVSVGGGLLVVPRFGYLGAATVVTCIDLVTWLATLRAVRRAYGSVFLPDLARPVLAAVAMAVVLAAGQALLLPLPVRIGCGLLIFGLVALPAARVRVWRSLLAQAFSPIP
jgi:PST family polysaccharide transporter